MKKILLMVGIILAFTSTLHAETNFIDLVNTMKETTGNAKNSGGSQQPSEMPEQITASTIASPSFDCLKASSGSERLICSNVELVAADARLAHVYKNALSGSADKGKLKREQNMWRISKRDACSDAECILNTYNSRMTELEALVEQTQQETIAAPAAQDLVASEVAPVAQVPSLQPLVPETGDISTSASTPIKAAAAAVQVPTLESSTPVADSTRAIAPSWEDRLVKIALISAVVAFVLLLIAGMTNTVVIWYDWADFMISLSIFLSGFFGFILVLIFSNDPVIDNVMVVITVLAVVGFSIQTMRLSIKHNSNLLIGIIVGIFKISLAVFSIFFVLGKFQTIFNDSKASNSTKFLAIAMLGVFAWILKRLINGERVYEKKGLNFQVIINQ